MNKAIAEGTLFRIEKGIYSDSEGRVREEEILQKKYPSAVMTLRSAFMYHSYSDFIPDKYELATDSKSARIADGRVVQYYMPEGTLGIGLMELAYDGMTIRTYDLTDFSRGRSGGLVFPSQFLSVMTNHDRLPPGTKEPLLGQESR